jgi:hypothetical protein
LRHERAALIAAAEQAVARIVSLSALMQLSIDGVDDVGGSVPLDLRGVLRIAHNVANIVLLLPPPSCQHPSQPLSFVVGDAAVVVDDWLLSLYGPLRRTLLSVVACCLSVVVVC